MPARVVESRASGLKCTFSSKKPRVTSWSTKVPIGLLVTRATLPILSCTVLTNFRCANRAPNALPTGESPAVDQDAAKPFMGLEIVADRFPTASKSFSPSALSATGPGARIPASASSVMPITWSGSPSIMVNMVLDDSDCRTVSVLRHPGRSMQVPSGRPLRGRSTRPVEQPGRGR